MCKPHLLVTSDDRELPDRDVLRYNVSLYDSLMDLNEAVDTAKTVMSAWSDRLAVCIVTTTVGVVQQRIEESKPENTITASNRRRRQSR